LGFDLKIELVVGLEFDWDIVERIDLVVGLNLGCEENIVEVVDWKFDLKVEERSIDLSIDHNFGSKVDLCIGLEVDLSIVVVEEEMVDSFLDILGLDIVQ